MPLGENAAMGHVRFVISVLVLCLLYAFLVVPQFDQAVIGDESVMASAGENLSGDTSPSGMPVLDRLYHPHGFPIVIGAASRFLGLDIVTGARCVTLLCNLAVIAILCLVQRRSSRAGEWPLLAGAVYAVLPLANRAGALIHRDSSLFTLCLVCVLLCLAHHQSRMWRCFLPVALFIAFWTKLTASVQLVICLVFLLPFAGKELRRGLVLSLLESAAAFLVSWYFYCQAFGCSFGGPLNYVYSTVASRVTGEANSLRGLLGTARFLLSMLAGFGLLGTILWLIALIRGGLFLANALRDTSRRMSLSDESNLTLAFAVLFSLSSSLGYAALGKDVFGFPIYHYPAVCTSALLVGWFLRENPILGATNRSVSIILAILASAPLLALVQGDVAWTCITLPRIYFLGESKDVAWIVFQFLRIVLGALLAIALFWFVSGRVQRERTGRGMRTVSALVLAFAACSVAQDLRQATAPYSTLYGYGEEETSRAAAQVAAGLQPGERILGPWYLVYNAYLQRGGRWTYPRYDWATREEDRLVSELKRPDTKFFAVSIWSIPISRRKQLLAVDEIQRLLDERYEKTKTGTWTIWEKRDFTGPDRNNL